MSVEALVFDVDGTLADTEETHRQAFNDAFRACGLDWSWSPALYAELLKVTGGKERIAHYIERLAPAADIQREWLGRITEIHALKTRLYQELVDSGRLHPRPGVTRLMNEARNAGIKLAIASTTSPQNVASLIKASFGPQVLGWFAAIATGDAVSRKKPAPDIYHLALARLAVPCGRAIAFEDSVVGVRAAKAAGLFTVATPSVWTAGEDFAAADLTVQSLDRLGLEQLILVHSAFVADGGPRAHVG